MPPDSERKNHLQLDPRPTPSRAPVSPLDPDRKVLLHLAGTVALPSPPPSGATVEILPSPDPVNVPEETYLRLTRRISHNVLIRWTVPLNRVSALAAPRHSFPPDPSAEPSPFGDGWAIRTSADLVRLANQKIAASRSGAGEPLAWMDQAVVFVPEATPVLRQAESGLTAAESVEYFGPSSVERDPSPSYLIDGVCGPNDRRPG